MESIVNDKRGQEKPEQPAVSLAEIEAFKNMIRVLANLEALIENGMFSGAFCRAVPECLECVRRLKNDAETKLQDLKSEK